MKKLLIFILFFILSISLIPIFQSNADSISSVETTPDDVYRPLYGFDSITFHYGVRNVVPVVQSMIFSDASNYLSSSTTTTLYSTLGSTYAGLERSIDSVTGSTSNITYKLARASNDTRSVFSNSFRTGTDTETRYHYVIEFTFYDLFIDVNNFTQYDILCYLTEYTGTSIDLQVDYNYNYIDYDTMNFSSVNYTQSADPGSFTSLLPPFDVLTEFDNKNGICYIKRLVTRFDYIQVAGFNVGEFVIKTPLLDGPTFLSTSQSITTSGFPIIDYGINDASGLGTSLLRGASNFLSVEIFPGFSFLNLLFICIAIPLFLWIIKLFLGG